MLFIKRFKLDHTNKRWGVFKRKGVIRVFDKYQDARNFMLPIKDQPYFGSSSLISEMNGKYFVVNGFKYYWVK